MLDRIRKKNGSSREFAKDIGKATAALAKEDDVEVIEEEELVFEKKFREGLAEELGADKEDISPEFLSKLSDIVVRSDIGDIVDQGGSDEDEDSEEEDLF